MIRSLFKPLVSAISLTASLLAMTVQSAFAASLYNGWQYTIDVSNDGLGVVNGVTASGNTIHEFYGMAIHDDGTNIWVALNFNLPLQGNITGPTLTTTFRSETRTFDIQGNSIAWGDLFFDFSGTGNLKTANDTGQLFGVRFAPGSDNAGSFSSGVYSNVSGIHVAHTNGGFHDLQLNDEFVRELSGLNAQMGDLAATHPYFSGYFDNPRPQSPTQPSTTLFPTLIGSGNLIGSITLRTQTDLENQGFDLSRFFQRGSEIFGFSFVKPAGFQGDFIATITQECLNEAMTMLGRIAAPPPPPPAPTPPLSCPPTSLAEKNAVFPIFVNGNVKYFQNEPSNRWYDPPVSNRYIFETLEDTLFTKVLDFPCGLGIQDPVTKPTYQVTVDGQRLMNLLTNSYDFKPGDSLDFSQYSADLGNSLKPSDIPGKSGVSKFSIDVIFPFNYPGPDPEDSLSWQLEFDKERSDFSIAPVPEPTTILGSILAGGGLLAAVRRRQR